MTVGFVELFQLAQTLQAKNKYVSFGIFTS
jgi:hypothetical protein